MKGVLESLAAVGLLGLVALGLWYTSGGGAEHLALKRVQRHVTAHGESVAEWMARNYADEFQRGSMRWFASDVAVGVSVYVQRLSSCGLWVPAYRWTADGSVVVSSSRSALELTPDLAPATWLDAFDDGCVEVPARESYMQSKLATEGWPESERRHCRFRDCIF
jgi:hypothetical protein